MTKIPVAAIIKQAYRFAFQDFFKILGAVWAPWAIGATGGFFLMPRLMEIFIAAGKEDFATAYGLGGPLVLFLPLAALLYVVQIAATVELALQSSPKQAWFRFPIGKPTWRLLGAYLLILLVYIGVWIGALLVSLVIGLGAGLLAAVIKISTVVALSANLVSFVIYAGFIYATARLAFLVAPVVIAEQKISLRRAGGLVRGNFWRLLLVLLAVFVPFWLLQRIVVMLVMPAGLAATLPPDAPPAIRMAAFAHLMNWAAHLTGEFRDHWYITYPVSLAWSVVYLGVIFGAQAFAYRALVPATPVSASPL